MGAMTFSMSDLYPSFGMGDTSSKSAPDGDDMESLGENRQDVEEATSGARPKNILIGAVILLAAVVMLGGAG